MKNNKLKKRNYCNNFYAFICVEILFATTANARYRDDQQDRLEDRQDSQDRRRNDDRYDNNRSNWY